MLQPIRVILSGGGTGGHIYPAIAIADALMQRHAKNELLFVGAKGRMEMQQVPAAGYPIIGLNIQGIQRRKLFANIGLPFKLIISLLKARKIIQQFRPHVVIGTGGYASVPILYIASKTGIPTLIQEQNAYGGIANKFLAKRVNKICVAYEGMESFFPAHKISFTGNPIRSTLTCIDSKKRKEALRYFELDAQKKCLLVIGGSLGSRMINQFLLNRSQELIENDIQLLWSTGDYYFNQLRSALPEHLCRHVKMYPFIKKIELAYIAADVVISRGGGIAISELCVIQKPTIFIPSSNVVADHQFKNITPLITSQAALLVQDHEIDFKLMDMLISLLNNTSYQQALVTNMKYFLKPKSTDHIVDEIIKLTALLQYKNEPNH